MAEKGSEPQMSERDRRLAEALRENLRKRKQQLRGRRAGDADSRSSLPALATEKTENQG